MNRGTLRIWLAIIVGTFGCRSESATQRHELTWLTSVTTAQTALERVCAELTVDPRAKGTFAIITFRCIPAVRYIVTEHAQLEPDIYYGTMTLDAEQRVRQISLTGPLWPRSLRAHFASDLARELLPNTDWPAYADEHPDDELRIQRCADNVEVRFTREGVDVRGAHSASISIFIGPSVDSKRLERVDGAPLWPLRRPAFPSP